LIEGLQSEELKNLMKRILLIFVTFVLLWQPASFARERSLANEGKRGLYVRSIDEMLRLSEDEIDLATAALIVSERWSDLVHGRRYLSMLDNMAFDIQQRLSKNWLKPNYKAIPIINRYLFHEHGFKSASEATDPDVLLLHTVLDRKRGYCLSLSILYLAIGERLGMPLYGVVVPGHFFVRYDDGYTKMNIETTNAGASYLDKHYIEKFKVPQNNNDSIYMKNLSKLQTLGCLFNNLGNAYNDLGDTESASIALEFAVQINPTLPESRSNLGNILLKKADMDGAIREYRIALQINPNDAKVHNNLGNAYIQQGWFDDAIVEYMQAIQADPNFIDAHRNLAVAYCKVERFERAVDQLQRAIEIEPEDAELFSQLGDVYNQMGKYREAILRYKKALAIKPDHAQANFGLGLCYKNLGLVEDEILAYRRALTYKPDLLPALLNLANVYFANKNYDAAIRYYKKATDVDPNDPWILYNLGAAYFNKSDYRQAVAAYLKAIELKSDIGEAHYRLAYGLYQLGRFDQAWKHINIAKQLGVEIPKDHFEAIKNRIH
jgi:tetratricopeptide (TPR) repeat protein